ncbi:MAG: hypothetical protein GY847_16715 [Proteobacteria bacterium]|nr:hypothetical protein [Pseudomonadota bacterium]
MKRLGCSEIFRGAICPRCKKTFFVCRRCDRGHVYCCRQCSATSRLEKCRVYRKQYRRSKKGRKNNSDRERDRRRQLILGKEIVGDHSYKVRSKPAMVSAPVRMSAVLAAIGGASGEETKDGEVCCEFCGRRARFVYFGDGSTQQRKHGTVFRYSD